MLKNLRLNTAAIERVVGRSPRTDRIVDEIQDDIIREAKQAYSSAEMHGNESRTSETSPPRYLSSFGKDKRNGKWYVYNDDPAATMVEFGAHPGGGEAETLKYAPLRRGLDAIVNRGG